MGFIVLLFMFAWEVFLASIKCAYIIMFYVTIWPIKMIWWLLFGKKN